jgi:hypothetical protein
MKIFCVFVAVDRELNFGPYLPMVNPGSNSPAKSFYNDVSEVEFRF